MKRLRVGVILNGATTNVYVASFYDWVKAQSDIELAVTLVPISEPNAPGAKCTGQPTPRHQPDTGREWAFRAVLWSEKALVKFVAGHWCRLSVIDLGRKDVGGFAGVPTLPFRPSQGLAAKEFDRLKELDIDVLINFSDISLPDSILALSRLGALRIDYHRDRMAAAAPVGFWEPYHRIPKTRFAISRASAGNDSEELMLEGSFRTQFSFLLNQAHLYRKSLAQLQQMLLAASRTGELPPSRASMPHRGEVLAQPRTGETVSYLLKLIGRISTKAIHRVLNIRQKWGIQITQTDWRNTSLLHASKIAAPPGHFWADPFLRTYQGRTYCFVEDYLYATKRAHISVLEIVGKKVVPLGIALKEDFHLSFPFIFEYDDQIYMCPEASESNQIRIYKATSFPLQWELCSVAMDNISAADSMFFEHNGKWWLLTSIDRTGLNDHCSELCLYYADSPLSSQWTAHPKNPLYVDAEAGRNAGLIIDKGKILRAAQKQGFDQYGEGLAIYEIVRLDERNYEETKVKDFGHMRPNHSLGSHHISTTGNVTVVDYLTRRFSP